MAPSLRQRKRGRNDSERGEIQATEKIIVTPEAALAAARNKESGHGSHKIKKVILTELAEVAAARKRLPGGQESQKRQPKTMTFDDLFGSDYDEVPGYDTEEFVSPDRKTAIEAALAIKAECQIESDEDFKRLNTILESNNLSADQPYKYAMSKVLAGEAISREVREEIFNYIQQKVMDVQQFLCQLFTVQDWDDAVASCIVDIIEEVTKHIAVEVTDLQEIRLQAESIINEYDRVNKFGKAEYLKDLVRCWFDNTWRSEKIAREWVDNPTASFSSCDPDEYDDKVLRRWRL